MEPFIQDLKEKQEKYNSFLNDLRESGSVNMFGAGPYLQEEFSLSKQEAKVALIAWMQTFEG